MKVRCIDGDGWRSIHINECYDVIEESDEHYLIINNCGNRLKYPKECFEVVEMEKQIVTVNVGSEIVYIHQEPSKVTEIDVDSEIVRFDDGLTDSFDCVIYFDAIKSINGIPVDQISEVRIAGYNDKVTLKIRDILTFREDCINDESLKIVNIIAGKIIRQDEDRRTLSQYDYWYVNGKKYHCDNIIIPDSSDVVVDKHDEIVQQSIDMANAAKELEPVKLNVDISLDQFVQVDEMVEPITKDNILAVLDFNGIPTELYKLFKHEILVYSENRLFGNSFEFINPNWLQHVELYFGKLKPLPKFDFKQYLLDNGFTSHIDGDPQKTNDLYFKYNDVDLCAVFYDATTAQFYYNGKEIEPIKENADILIEMAKLAEGLK